MNTIKLWVYFLLTRWLPESRCFRFKNMLLRWAGAVIGENVRIYSSVRILGNGGLTIGNDVHIGPGGLIYAVRPKNIVIGSHVDIGPQVTLLTGTHEIEPDGDHMGGKGRVLPVEIGDGCWICARAVILPGVNLAKMTSVAAGAVVTESVLRPRTLVAGVPAVHKKQL